MAISREQDQKILADEKKLTKQRIESI